MKTISTLPSIEWIDLSKYSDQRKSVIFTSPSAYRSSQPYIKGLSSASQVYLNSADFQSVNKLSTRKYDAEVAYAVGGGLVIDVARYIAKQQNLEIICIPTAITTDAFLVDCTGLRKNKGVTYYPSKKADKILLDSKLLLSAPKELNLSGCGDVLSIYTGLWDWKYSQDNYQSSVAHSAQGILDGLMSETSELKSMTPRSLETLVTQLASEVQLCYFYGNSRPEEGGEHFFVYSLENMIGHALHGEMVGLGILVTSFIQGQPVTPILEFMQKIGMGYKPEGITDEIILDNLKGMQKYVKMHGLAKSVYSDFSFPKMKSSIKDFLKTI